MWQESCKREADDRHSSGRDALKPEKEDKGPSQAGGLPNLQRSWESDSPREPLHVASPGNALLFNLFRFMTSRAPREWM